MISVTLIVFREIFEIALIVGILMSATKGLIGRTRWISIGVLIGIVGACMLAMFTDAISQAAEGMGQELFNASILLVAAALIGWTTLWMARHGRQMTKEFNDLGMEMTKGSKPLYLLALVVALSTLREGAEVVMFVYSAWVSGEKVQLIMAWGLFGSLLGIVVGVAVYYGLMKLPTKKIFSFISWLLVFLVAGMIAQAFGFLTATGKVPEIIGVAWDSSGILAQDSILGQALHALVGYTDRPSGTQIIVYILTIGGFSMLLKLFGHVNLKDSVPKIVGLMIGIAFLWAIPSQSHAGMKVYSPIVEQGEWELEARGKSNNSVIKQKYAVGYGLTDRWFTEVYGEWERVPGDPKTTFTAVSWENRFQFTEQGEFIVDVGGYLEYEHSYEALHANKLEAKLLLEKSLPDFTHTFNLIFEHEVGQYATKGVMGGLAWSTKYRWQEWLEPGVEWYSEFGELGKNQSPEHQIGLVFFGKVGSVKYDVGYLIGMSDSAPKNEVKWVFEYEFH